MKIVAKRWLDLEMSKSNNGVITDSHHLHEIVDVSASDAKPTPLPRLTDGLIVACRVRRRCKV